MLNEAMGARIPADVQILLSALDRAYDRPSWHGTNLRGSVRRVTPALAAWRPHPDRHNVWELVVHCADWKYAAWRRLTGERRGSFPLKGSNWFARPTDDVSERAWRDDLALLDDVHRRLREAVATLKTRDLPRRIAGGKVTIDALVTGVVAHDLYHAGQIQLLKKLAG
jgi:uncharacterized damage-inducible protein DinB